MRFAIAAGLALLLPGCAPQRDFAPLPPQAPLVEAADPPAYPCFVAFSERRADTFIVRDIPLGLYSGFRRWTGADPAVRCTLPDDGPWQAAMDFTLMGDTFRDTGPIHIAFRVNGVEVGRLLCEKPARYQFRAPIPRHLARQGAEAVLDALIDKPWIAAADGARLGVILDAMGFVAQ